MAATVGSTVATNVVTADQYIAIVLPGRMFKGAFQKRGLAPVVLSRSLGDSATVTSALIPWNSCGAFMAATLGVATVAYAAVHVLQYPESADFSRAGVPRRPHAEGAVA